VESRASAPQTTNGVTCAQTLFLLLPARQQTEMGSPSAGRRPRQQTGTKKDGALYAIFMRTQQERGGKRRAVPARRAAAGEDYSWQTNSCRVGTVSEDCATATRPPSSPTPNGYNGYRHAGVSLTHLLALSPAADSGTSGAWFCY